MSKFNTSARGPRSVLCICNQKIPIQTIGIHAQTCQTILVIKREKKAQLLNDKKKEMELFSVPKPPCLCNAKYDETRELFSLRERSPIELSLGERSPIELSLGERSSGNTPHTEDVRNITVFIDFPNINTGTHKARATFRRFLHSLYKYKAINIYMKSINKQWFLKTLKENQEIRTDQATGLYDIRWEKITVYIVESDKAPVSRDDILMLKHLSVAKNAALVVRDGGEKYRDLGYHPIGIHEPQCSSLQRFGSTDQFRWIECEIQKGKYVNQNNYKSNVNYMIVATHIECKFITYS